MSKRYRALKRKRYKHILRIRRINSEGRKAGWVGGLIEKPYLYNQWTKIIYHQPNE